MARYEPEFISTGLKLSDELGPTRAAKAMGVSRGVLDRWRRRRSEGKFTPTEPLSVGQLLSRIRELERLNAALQKTNRLLIEAVNAANGFQPETNT